MISHGYGGRNIDYGFLARALAARGYVVASIQQDLPGDPVPASRGDLATLFAVRHPGLARAVFSLDNRRMAMPRIARPRICSVRSSDFPADPGVLPTPAEQKAHGMLIAGVPGLRHDDMSDAATPAHRRAMLALLFACLDG